jgi:anthranilate synthase component 1
MDSCRVVTAASAFRATARDALADSDHGTTGEPSAGATAGVVRIPVEVRVTVDDPWAAYRRARSGDGDWGIFLETTGGDASERGSAPGAPGEDANAADGSGDDWCYFTVDPVETLTTRPDAVPVDGSRNGGGKNGGGRNGGGRNGGGRNGGGRNGGGRNGGGRNGGGRNGGGRNGGGRNGGGRNGGGDGTPGAGADSPSLAALEGLLDGTTLARGDCDVPYPCGAFGWLSYDVARELEDLPGDADRDRDLPRVQVGVYDRVAAWRPGDGSDTDGGDTDGGAGGDGDGTTLRITACPALDPAAFDEGGGSAGDGGVDDAIEAAYERGVGRARSLAERAVEGDSNHGPPPASSTVEAAFESDAGRAAYAERVRRVKAWIRDGDTFQANVSHRLRAPATVHPVAVYDALRRVNPAPYSGLVEFPGVDLVSASPELLLERDGDRVRTEPIAGTRPRGDTDAADAALEAELKGDEKERAEHAMLVDLERNDLGKVCAYGSVDVAEYRRVDRYSEVMHLVSDVTGRLREGVGIADAVGAVFPGGTITGAPKPRTMAIIDAVEDTRRGPYTGSMAAFGFDDRATCNIVIRTLTRYRKEYHLRVGAGIVHDSDPEREYDETLDKARALLTAVDDALESESTMDVEAPDA